MLRIGYTGSLYNGLRKMDAIFDVLSSLEMEFGQEVPVKVCYAGSESGQVLSQAKRYNTEKYVVDYGMVDRKEALHIQEESDILCVLSWNTKNEQGILTGKFPEYLRLRKPVLALIDGDLPCAELTERINELNIGFSFEYMDKNVSNSQLSEWLKNAIYCKRNNIDICSDIKLDMIKEYSYLKLVKRLYDVLTTMLSK